MSSSTILSADNQKNSRNYGLDFLRIICMIMIPVLHINVNGGIMPNCHDKPILHAMSLLIECFSICAVNCYALISGYVSYGRKTKYSNLLYLYLQVVVYILVITGIYAVIKPETFTFGSILKAVFPFAYDVYWYFTAYFCLFLFSPFLNRLVESSSSALLRRLLCTMLIAYSIIPIAFNSEFANIEKGYSFVWLSAMYLLGAIIKKNGFSPKYKNGWNFLGYFIFVVLQWLSGLAIGFVSNHFLGGSVPETYLLRYNSPLNIGASVFLFLFFLKLPCKNTTLRKLIHFFAPVSFGVYLLHEEPLIRETFFTDKFKFLLDYPSVLVIPAVIGCALAVWLFGSLIDHVRLSVFNLLHIRQLCVLLEKKTQKLYHKLFDLILRTTKKLFSSNQNDTV